MSYGEGTYGDGNFGGVSAPPEQGITIRVKSRVLNIITLEWDLVPDADGFNYYKNGQRVSRTLAGSTTHARFSFVPGDTFVIAAFKIVETVQGSVKA
jgi:hypothetical protein